MIPDYPGLKLGSCLGIHPGILTLFMTVGGAFRYGAVDVGGRAQDPANTIGNPTRPLRRGAVWCQYSAEGGSFAGSAK